MNKYTKFLRLVLCINLLFIVTSIGHSSPEVELRLSEARKAYIDRDYEKSFILFSKLADDGNAIGHFNKAILLAKGLGAPQNYSLSLKSFRSAALLGVVPAKTQLGVIYIEGLGTPKNFSEGLKWLKEASSEGDYSANFQLARILTKADGGYYKPNEAIIYLEKILKSPKNEVEWRTSANDAIKLYSSLKNISPDETARLFLITKDILENKVNQINADSGQAILVLKEKIDKLELEKNEQTQKAIDESKRASNSEEKLKFLAESVKLETQKPNVAYSYLDVHALIIGNGKYEGSAKLKNPANDAKSVAGKFKDLGFKVVLRLDLDRKGLVNTFNDFSRSAKNADIVIFYYAGHGIQIFGNNFILPIDVDVNDFGQASLQAIPLGTVLDQYLPGKTRLVFLDACRENPLVRSSSRGVSRGLAPMSVAEGTLISYATKDGGIALDGEGDTNSPFTLAILKHIDEPNDIAVILRRVRQSVINSTNSKQIPWEYGSLTGDSLILSRIKPINKKEK